MARRDGEIMKPANVLTAILLVLAVPGPLCASERCDDIPDADARLECYRERSCEAGEDELACYRKIIVEMNEALSDGDSADRSSSPVVDAVGPAPTTEASGIVATEQTAANEELPEAATEPQQSASTGAQRDEEEWMREKAVDVFGLEDGLVMALSGSEWSVDAIEANVVSVANPGGIRTVLLDNGQVWRENERSRLRLFSGQHVVISRRTFSYSLKAERGGSGKVHRVNCAKPEHSANELCSSATANE
jgi:hypothetical protein